MQEIFAIAKKCLQKSMDEHGFQSLSCQLKGAGKEDQWRVLQQGYRLYRLAEDRCTQRCRDNPQDKPMSAGEVEEELTFMEARYAEGWSREGMWCVKEHESSEKLMDTLSFLRCMGLRYQRSDGNALEQSLHLRIPNETYDMVFNPSLAGNGQSGQEVC